MKSPAEPSVDDLLSGSRAGKLAKVSARMMCRLAAEGRIPFAIYLANRWLFTQESVDFLLEHYPSNQRHKQRGLAGHIERETMLKAAAKLDAACKLRQDKLPQYWERKVKTKSGSATNGQPVPASRKLSKRHAGRKKRSAAARR